MVLCCIDRKISAATHTNEHKPCQPLKFLILIIFQIVRKTGSRADNPWTGDIPENRNGAIPVFRNQEPLKPESPCFFKRS